MEEIFSIILGIISSLLSIFLFLIFFGPLILKIVGTLWIKLTTDKLNEQIAWCANESPHARCGLSLLDHLCRAQRDNNIALSYRIDNSEKNIAQEILQSYQKDLLQKHFDNHFTYKKMPCEDFFMLTLQKYLKEHICDVNFNDQKMYIIKRCQEYGRWGGTHFDAIYVFTDYATVYHKIYHISQVYCLPIHKKNYKKSLKKDVYEKLLNNGSLGENEIQTTQKRLLAKEMEVSNL